MKNRAEKTRVRTDEARYKKNVKKYKKPSLIQRIKIWLYIKEASNKGQDLVYVGGLTDGMIDHLKNQGYMVRWSSVEACYVVSWK